MVPLKTVFWFGCVLRCFTMTWALPTTPSGNANNSDDDLFDFNKRRQEVKKKIYETLGIDPNLPFPQNQEEKEKLKKYKERMNSDIMKNILFNTAENVKEIVFMNKEDAILEHCKSGQYVKELTLQFVFDLKIFQENTLTNAYIYFYKRDDSPAEEILVKEVPDVGTHEHTINRAFFRQNGWLQLDITKQVDYWSEDFGYSESRTLKLMCAQGCSELYIEYCDSKALPFLTFGFTTKKN